MVVVFLVNVNAHGVADCAVRVDGGSDLPAVLMAMPQSVVDAGHGKLRSAHGPDEVGLATPPRLRDVAQAVGLLLGDGLHGIKR